MSCSQFVSPVLDRLGDVVGADAVNALQVRDGAGNAEDAVIAAGRELHGVESGAQERVSLFIRGSEGAKLPALHAGVAHGAVGEALPLFFPRGVDPLADGGRSLRRCAAL